jgi:hypothetical protein
VIFDAIWTCLIRVYYSTIILTGAIPQEETCNNFESHGFVSLVKQYLDSL